MSQSRIEKAVQALAEPIAEELNYELVDLEFKRKRQLVLTVLYR